RENKETKEIESIFIADNRNKEQREVVVSYEVTKGKEVYLLEPEDTYSLTENNITYSIKTTNLKNIPEGDYKTDSVFYSDGEKVEEKSTYLEIEREGGIFNAKYIFYVILGLIVISVVLFFTNAYTKINLLERFRKK
ncbi:MAG: hypothetical protein GY861_00790, partial [bacterium]|nr:hypothetical protein [bacterium]